MEEDLKTQLMRHISRLPIAWFDRVRTGDLLSRLTQDVELLRFLTGPSLLYGGQSVVVVPGGLYLMVSLSPAVAGIAGIAFGALIAGVLLLLPRLQKSGRAAQEAIGAISQRAQEDFSGVRVLLAFARAREEVAEMRRLSQDYLGHNVVLARYRAQLHGLIHACLDVVVLGILVAGALEVAAGNMTRGELLEYLALLGVMVWPLLATGWILASFHRAVAAAERIEEIFALQPEPSGGESPELSGHLLVRGLTFRYEGQERPALVDLSFELRPDQKLGIVGPVGSGKSTLLALLLRLYDPPRGTILADGYDVLDLSPSTLRRTFALAPQDPFLFSDTIAGNIVFGTGGNEAPGRSGLADALHTADIEGDLARFESGLETVVGERGVTLSGGQKQRVSLARAMASDRQTLVLDDALSAVDHPTESRILTRLGQLRGERTLIVAAHRLSAVRDSDLILVLDQGRLVQSGTHDELLRQPGFYADSWRRQSEARALEGDAD